MSSRCYLGKNIQSKILKNQPRYHYLNSHIKIANKKLSYKQKHFRWKDYKNSFLRYILNLCIEGTFLYNKGTLFQREIEL